MSVAAFAATSSTSGPRKSGTSPSRSYTYAANAPMVLPRTVSGATTTWPSRPSPSRAPPTMSSMANRCPSPETIEGDAPARTVLAHPPCYVGGRADAGSEQDFARLDTQSGCRDQAARAGGFVVDEQQRDIEADGSVREVAHPTEGLDQTEGINVGPRPQGTGWRRSIHCSALVCRMGLVEEVGLREPTNRGGTRSSA